MATVIVIVLLAALAGWIFVKNDEMSGLGRNVKKGGPRHPHGKLESVEMKGEAPAAEPLGQRFSKSFPLISTGVLLVGAIAFGMFGLPGSKPVMGFFSSGLPALVIAAEATLRASEGKKTFWTYVYALVAAVLCALVVWEAFAAGFAPLLSSNMQLAAYAIVTTMLFGLGAGACVALLPQKIEFERTFEDGAKRTITVSTRSAAYGAYVAMMGETSKED